jgi:hypothetical protein
MQCDTRHIITARSLLRLQLRPHRALPFLLLAIAHRIRFSRHTVLPCPWLPQMVRGPVYRRKRFPRESEFRNSESAARSFESDERNLIQCA